jgi:hypothetical protein
VLLLVLWPCLWPGGAAAAGDRLPQPKGPVVLTIGGDIERTTDGSHALFDVAMLQALGMVTVRTRTPWTHGVSEFEGVLLRDVLRLVGARGDTIRASALNDYVAEIPASDPASHDVILALKKDGEYLTVRTMGPILVLYPFDEDPVLQTEAVYTRSVWQLAELEVGAPVETAVPAEGGAVLATLPLPQAPADEAADAKIAAVPAPEAPAPVPTGPEETAASEAAAAALAEIAPASGAAAEPEAPPAVEPEGATVAAIGAPEMLRQRSVDNIPNGASLGRNALGRHGEAEGGSE